MTPVSQKRRGSESVWTGGDDLSGDMAGRLRSQTSSLVGAFTRRLSGFREHPELSSLVRGIDNESALRSAKQIIGEGEFLSVGIDGSMDYDERLEMLLFYVCSTAFCCPISVADSLSVRLREAKRDSRLSVSAAVPLWMEDLSDVVQSTLALETELDFSHTMERIPYAIMTLGELSLALRSLEGDGVKVVFLDRPLSGTFLPASRDLRLLLRSGVSSLPYFTTEHGDLSLLDLSLASILGPGDLYVPKRGQYLVYAAIQALLSRGEMSRRELASELRLKDPAFGRLVRRLAEMNEWYEEGIFEKVDLSSVKLADGMRHYWERVSEVSTRVASRVFGGDEHPLLIGEGKWLTVLDLNAVNVFLLYDLMRESVEKKILVVGVTKDTTATDFTRSTLPLAMHKSVLSSKSPLPNLKNDRAFLTIAAAVNADAISTPWRTIGYDSCFATLIENPGQAEPRFRAARRMVGRERLFVKAYFQLRAFETDPVARSPVFVYDRFYDPERDVDLVEELEVLERERKVRITPYFEGSSSSEVDNLLLCLLSCSDNPEVLEAFGHNQLLYLADKAVKSEVKSIRGMLRGVADLELGTLARRERIFSISRRFRDLRAESEMARSRAAQGAMRS